MKRFIEGENRFQATLFPESLDDYIAEDNPVRVIDAFVNALDLKALGFERAEPSAPGRPEDLTTQQIKVLRELMKDIDHGQATELGAAPDAANGPGTRAVEDRGIQPEVSDRGLAPEARGPPRLAERVEYCQWQQLAGARRPRT